MFEPKKTEYSLSLSFSADFEEIQSVTTALEEFMEEKGVSDAGNFQVVVRQMLENAIIHGSEENPDKTVRLELDISGQDRISLSVEDQGSGFEHMALTKELEDPFSDFAGGLAIIQSFTEKMEFNDQGNRITVHLPMKKDILASTDPLPGQEDRATQINAHLEDMEKPQDNEDTRLDREHALAIMARAMEAANSGANKCVIDMGQMRDITVHGLNLLVGLKTHFKNFPETTLVITNAGEEIDDFMKMTGLV